MLKGRLNALLKNIIVEAYLKNGDVTGSTGIVSLSKRVAVRIRFKFRNFFKLNADNNLASAA